MADGVDETLDEVDSMSLSSPVSQVLMHVDEKQDDPVILNSLPTNGYAHFICLGETNANNLQLHADSYTKSYELNRVLNNEDPYGGNFNSVLNEFFGFNFLTETCLFDSIQQLFYTLRMKYNTIKDHATEMSQIVTKANEKEYLKNRMQIVKFLAYLKSFVITSLNELSENEVEPLFNHLKGLILLVGRISHSPVYITLQTSGKNQTRSPLYHFYHVNLDIVWSVIAILHSLPTKYSTTNYMKLTDDVNMQSQSLFVQYSSFIMSQLIQLALKCFQKISLHQYTNVSPFSCSCVAELWILLIHLLDKTHENHRGKSFWSYAQLKFNGILYERLNDGKNKEMSCDVLEVEPRIECEDRLGFCWWLLLHLCSLYEVNTNGVKSREISSRSNYTLLQTLISLSIQSEKTGEAQMRCYLNCCIKICNNWEPNTDVLLLLWNHFVRHINSNFCLPYSLDGLQSLCDSGDAWVKQIKGRLSGISNNDNSFHLYLYLFNEKTKKISDANQFKSRIFSKLDAKLMQDLNETGLHNFVTILLTVACEVDVEIAIEKMMEFVQVIPISRRISSQRLITWCGMFALLEICEEKQTETSRLVTKLTTEFIATSQQLKNPRMDGMERQQLTKLISLYVKGVESVVQKSRFLNLSHHILINSGISNVFINGSVEEVETTLSMIEVVLSKLRMTFMRHRNSSNPLLHELNLMATALSKHVLPFVKQHCSTQTPPTILADVAAGFTLMVFDMNVSIDLLSLFHHFALNSNVQPMFCSRYLCHVLHHNALIHNLRIDKDGTAYLLVGAWFRCVVSLPENNEYVRELSNLMTKLPAMQSMADLKDDDDEEKMYVTFLKALDVKFNAFENFQEKMSFKQNAEVVFKDILKHNGAVLKNFEPLDQLRQLYDVAAHIVKHCSLIVYVKSKADGIVHSIVHQLMLPRIVYCHDKPLPPNLPIVLRETLHLFVEGLFKLSPRRDTCISNRLKDIVIYYILRFPLKIKFSSGAQPLLACLKNQRNTFLVEFFAFALEVIGDQLTSRKNSLNSFVCFVHELHVNVSKEQKEQIERTLFVPLFSLLNHPDPNLKEKVYFLISKMLPSVRNSETSKTFVFPLLIRFLQDNIISVPQNAYKLLDVVAEMNVDFVKQLIPEIGKCIEIAEERRGVGQDANLRHLHQNLLKKLSCLV